MHILLVSASVPLPGQAGSPRTFQLARVIASRHVISLLLVDEGVGSFTSTSDYLSPGSPFSSVTTVKVQPSAAPVGLKLLNALCCKPSFAADIKRREERRSAVSAVQDQSRTADVVWIDGLSMLQYAETCGVPLVVDVVDFISRLRFAQARALESSTRRLVGSFRAWTVRRYEALHLADVGTVVLNSDVDARFMLADLGVSATVIVNGCDTDFFSRRDASPALAGSPALLFVGNYAYQPNHDAALYLIDEILPCLTKDFPDTMVYLVGPVPDYGFGTVPSNVKVVGYADDTRDYYTAADAFICPLRFGAGVKNKILEAAAMECPIVASGISMEGLAFEDGVHFLSANKPEEFKERIEQVVQQDGGVGESLGKRARKLVDSRYSWMSAGQQLESLLSEAAVARRHPR